MNDYLPGEVNSAIRKERTRPSRSILEPGASSFSTHTDGLLRAERSDTTIRILNSTTNQKLFVTDSGYMGLLHESCMIGDDVYLLMGGDMPFVLRKLSTGTYHFKGEAYVHGLMDGEYLVKTFKDKMQHNEEVSDEDWLDTLGDGPLPFPTETIVLS